MPSRCSSRPPGSTRSAPARRSARSTATASTSRRCSSRCATARAVREQQAVRGAKWKHEETSWNETDRAGHPAIRARRGRRARRGSPASRASPPSPVQRCIAVAASNDTGATTGMNGIGWSSSHGFGAAPSSPELEGGRRGKRGRAARAAAKQAERRAGGGAVGNGSGNGAAPLHGPSGHARHGGVVSTGIDAWLPEPLPPLPKTIEYRLQVRNAALIVSLFNPDTRTPLSPSALLAAQAETPTQDRGALRLLARFENDGPRRSGIEVRGEDAADLLPFLKGRRVIVEPQMMELRFGDEPLRPRFDLELSPDGAQVLVKSSFQRSGDPRKFTTAHGAWFEGSPGWFLDPQEGVARPLDRRVSSAAIHRLTRAPFIHEPIERLPVLIAQGLPKVALEVGAELPDLSQVAEVVDLVPTFRMRAGGSLVEAHVSLRAAYEDTEIDVRADGMTPPVIVKAPEPRTDKNEHNAATRALHPLRHRRAARRRLQAARARSHPRRGRQRLHRPRRRRHPVLDRGDRRAARRVGPLRARRSRRRAGAHGAARRQRSRRQRRRLALAPALLRERRRRRLAGGARPLPRRGAPLRAPGRWQLRPARRAEGSRRPPAPGGDPRDRWRRGRQAAAVAGRASAGAAQSR